jgi:transcriptional regulator with XRE-family HTH domain
MYNLKLIRIQKGMSQQELSDKSGVSRTTISNLENNDGAVTTTETMNKLAEALDCPPRFFLEKMYSKLHEEGD